MNGSIRIKTKKDGKPKSVNLEIEPNDQLKDRNGSMSEKNLSETQKTSGFDPSQTQKLNQSQVSSLSENKSESSTLEKDLLMKKFKARLDYETRSYILISQFAVDGR